MPRKPVADAVRAGDGDAKVNELSAAIGRFSLRLSMFVLQEIGKALSLSFAMFWQVLWPLALGFTLSAVVETLVSRQTISRLLGKDGLAR